jgi:hypothetical protein
VQAFRHCNCINENCCMILMFRNVVLAVCIECYATLGLLHDIASDSLQPTQS